MSLVASPAAWADDEGNWVRRGSDPSIAKGRTAVGVAGPFWQGDWYGQWVSPVAHPAPVADADRSTLKIVPTTSPEVSELNAPGQLATLEPADADLDVLELSPPGATEVSATNRSEVRDNGVAGITSPPASLVTPLEPPWNLAPEPLRVAAQASTPPAGGQNVAEVSPEISLDAPDEGDRFSADPLPEAEITPLEASAKSVGQPLEMRRPRSTAVSQTVGDAAVELSEQGQPGQRAFIGDLKSGDANGRSATSLSTPVEEEADGAPLPSQADSSLIVGDRVTAAGELILASGRHAAKQPLVPQATRIKPQIERALKFHWERPEDAAVRTHWGMMHSIMVFDKDTEILWNQKRYNAVAWMAGNNPCRNDLLFSEDSHGISVRTGVGLQGHQGQLLAIFGQINVPIQYPLYVGKSRYTVADVLEREMLDCKPKSELTFTLIGLAHYADSDSSWVSRDGQAWDVERVIREELAQPIVGAACGGTHRLMGFGHALRRRRAEGKPITGQWERANSYLEDFVEYTWTLQNRDGSMSTAWFERREDNGNLDRKIQTTGHMLELLMVVTPDDGLQSPEMLRVVEFLSNAMHNERGRDWQVGPKGHALRALAMYYQRLYGDSTPWRNATEERSTNRPSMPGLKTR